MNGMIDEAMPTQQPLDHDLAQGRRPKSIGSPLSRTTRMPEHLLAPGLAVVLAPRAPSAAARRDSATQIGEDSR